MTRLHPDTALDIRLSAIITRGKYTPDPATVISELRATAGDRTDLLHAAVGSWIGYYEDEHVRPLIDALISEFGQEQLQAGIDLGRSRRGTGHSTP